jgi:hypothetical protein
LPSIMQATCSGFELINSTLTTLVIESGCLKVRECHGG